MSTAAVMLVKDEADIIEATIDHLLDQVDEVIVCDNGSTDGTYEIAVASPARVQRDDEVGYYQSRKMTRLAYYARSLGHEWVVPCDADELWFAPTTGGWRINDWLAWLDEDVWVAGAALYDYLPPREGLNGWHPFVAINYRFPHTGALPKVACRLMPNLVIEMGNHDASYGQPVRRVTGLTIRHFSWRTREQYLRKIRNGIAAYEATDLDPMYGAHWRMFSGATDEAIMEHFDTHFSTDYPPTGMVHDPAPLV